MTPVAWTISDSPVAYPAAVAEMEAQVAAIRARRAGERVWLVEHPPLYTRGVSAEDSELLEPRLPVYETGRGGRFTYHGPGQRVAYVMLDLRAPGRRPDLRAYVRDLERWLIDTLTDFGVRAFRRDGLVGVWVTRADGAEAKIAALGVRVRRWVTFHGVSLNVEPELAHYRGIVPCGVRGCVTSLADLGVPVSMAEVDSRLRRHFERRFGPTVSAPAQGARSSGRLVDEALARARL
jgi:lipoyl(octanoyl) transferase